MKAGVFGCHVASFIDANNAGMLWRNYRGRPLNAPAAFIIPVGLVARIAADPEIATPGGPRRVHCGLPTEALLLPDSGGGLQHQHLVRRDREAPNLILWLLGR
jgi:hypothetical protein